MDEGRFSRTILIVDDDPQTRAAITLAFRRRGWSSASAATSAEAIALLDGGLVPHGLILALSLPDRDGNTVFEKIRHLRLATRVAILTGTTLPELLVRAKELKPDLFLMKPIGAETLAKLFLEWSIEDDAEPGASPGDDSRQNLPSADAGGLRSTPQDGQESAVRPGSPKRTSPGWVDRLPTRRPRILIVEDHETSRVATRKILIIMGFEVSTAATIAEGLEALVPPPDCILLDLALPDGSGELILEKVRAEGLPCRVVVCTGESDADRLITVRRLNPDAILSKPVRLDELVAACRP